ncbi:hypothetical protein [Bacillus changyiensis]|uniref:hypothetical protein n=1 Tax=Bacillus changyiensis TaxID=3004103 RepID=UPI0022E25367|nr:hypothetical protein [Bacillus changyiensis]MDA1476989.1 hypothetical protein [Bacillus changyiensis]
MNEDQDVKEFQKISVKYAILLTIITLGMYIPYWFLSRRQALEKFQIKIPYVAIKVTVVLFIFSVLEFLWILTPVQYVLGDHLLPNDYAFLLPLQPEDSLLKHFSLLLFIIVNIYSSLQVRQAFKQRFRSQSVNRLLTCLFQVAYLQYIVNKYECLANHYNSKSNTPSV